MAELKAKLILEILGRPVEHLTTSLGEVINRMKLEKGVTIISQTIAKPKMADAKSNLWSTYADLDISCATLPSLLNIIMNYLPAHIEVYEPESFRLNAVEVNELSNFIAGKLHNYDAIAKRLLNEREIFVNQLNFLRDGGDPVKVFGQPKKQISSTQQPTVTFTTNKPLLPNANEKKEKRKKKK